MREQNLSVISLTLVAFRVIIGTYSVQLDLDLGTKHILKYVTWSMGGLELKHRLNVVIQGIIFGKFPNIMPNFSLQKSKINL